MAKTTKKRLTVNELRYQTNELIQNAIMSRSQLMKDFLDPRRDINDECGYPRTENITAQAYRELYDREPVATRTVELLPVESWQSTPSVYEDEDEDVQTPFEEAWDLLGQQLRSSGPQPSRFRGDEGHPIWSYLQRADSLSGIGYYGVVLLGFDDGKNLEEPAVPREGQQLLYLRTFDQTLASIAAFDYDEKSPRFGQPTKYNVTFQDPSNQVVEASGTQTVTRAVHWSRIIHLADNCTNSEVFGVPRMRPVWNRLLDLQKLYGGSAEMYWRGAFPGLSIETHPGLEAEMIGKDIDLSTVRDQMEQYMNGLQRYLAMVGVSAKSLAPQVVDPTPQIDVHINAICIVQGCPRRIFEGSERGELASSQDARTWNKRLRHRQLTYVTPRVIVPFVDRLIQLKTLPEPEQYCVEWPNMDMLTEQEQATVAVSRTDALAKYVGGNVEALVPPMVYLTRILGFEDEEAQSIIDQAIESIEDRMTEPPVVPTIPDEEGNGEFEEEGSKPPKEKV